MYNMYVNLVMFYLEIKTANCANHSINLVGMERKFFHCLYNLKIEEAENALERIQELMAEEIQIFWDDPEHEIVVIYQKSLSDKRKKNIYEKEGGYLDFAEAMKREYIRLDSLLQYAKFIVQFPFLFI